MVIHRPVAGEGSRRTNGSVGQRDRVSRFVACRRRATSACATSLGEWVTYMAVRQYGPVSGHGAVAAAERNSARARESPGRQHLCNCLGRAKVFFACGSWHQQRDFAVVPEEALGARAEAARRAATCSWAGQARACQSAARTRGSPFPPPPPPGCRRGLTGTVACADAAQRAKRSWNDGGPGGREGPCGAARAGGYHARVARP